ncbi:hypothetical protein ACHQM5_026290 [Ranunculus cassubicifolius]
MNIISTTSNPISSPAKISSSYLPPQSPPKKPHSTISLLQLCHHVDELLQVHSLLIKTSLIHEKHAFGRLLLHFASFDDHNSLNYTQKLFETIEFPRNTFIYNTMIRAFLNHGYPREAFLCYSRMLCEEFVCIYPDNFTFTFVLAACSKLFGVFEGKQVHAHMVKYPIRFGIHSWNSLMDFYVKIGETGAVVKRIFDDIENPDGVSWNCLLDGYVKSGSLDSATKVFDEMPQRDIFSWTSMLIGYANAGLLDEASRVFDRMPERNVVSWSAMIGGYVRSGCCKEALDLFKKMQKEGVKADKITLTSVLTACASLGAFDQGCWIHAYIDKHRIDVDAHLSTALVDMYTKCGRVDVALNEFQKSREKKVFLWNAILGGLAMHSRGKEAVELFSKMLDERVKPNDITFICVLSACSHSGLVDDGLRIFQYMVNESNVLPTVEHYGCVVDLLSRAGMLHEARQIINTMPMEADSSIWRTLLGACILYGDIEMGIEVGKFLIDLEPLDDANYVLLSNIYATGGRWKDVEKLRRIMKARGVSKRPGCSSIELNGIVHEFIAGDTSHPENHDIYELLEEMANHLPMNP